MSIKLNAILYICLLNCLLLLLLIYYMLEQGPTVYCRLGGVGASSLSSPNIFLAQEIKTLMHKVRTKTTQTRLGI